MLSSLRTRFVIVVNSRGAALVEYAILLAFIAVLALLFSNEHLPSYASEDSSEIIGSNLSTAVSMTLLKVQVVLMRLVNW